MPSRAVSCESRGILKLLAAVLLASASAACSSDSSRFGENAFTNPFAASASSKVDRAPTGSLATRSAPLQPVATQPLPPALPRTAGVANPLNPTQVASAPQAATARVASSTLQQAAPIGGSAAGWSATGGTPVTVGAGETASTLSARYGVPAAAILAANGGAIRSGQQAIIPIYNGAGAARTAATTTATTAATTASTAATTAATTAASSATSAASSTSRSGLKAIEPTLLPDEDERPAPRAAASTPAARPVASAPKPVAATPVAPKLTPPKPVAATPAPAKAAATPDSSRRIVAAAPKAPTPAQAAAKPARPATAVKPANDDDDEDEKPRKVVAQAQPTPQPAPKPVAPQAKPAQPQTQATQPARPQPRVIPMTPQKEEAPARSAALMQADPTTTQSIPPAKAQPAAVAPAPAAAAPPRSAPTSAGPPVAA